MHAFLIAAHNNWGQLGDLLSMLDNELSDIYIHIDKKVQFRVEDRDALIKRTQFSKVTFCERYSVSWGGDSLINATLSLLKEATKKKHEYYHLISGADLPLKSINEIEVFFKENRGKEFVQFVPNEYQEEFQKRIKYYWFWQETIGNPRRYLKKFSWKTILLLLQRGIVEMQKIIKIDRRDKNIKYYAGANWFSITHEFACYIVSKEDWIKKTFSKTLCTDEMFVQTLLMNSQFKTSLFCKGKDSSSSSANQRLVDWGRGNPYVFKIEDLDMLKNNNLIFARKFDETIDKQIIKEIKTWIVKQKV